MWLSSEESAENMFWRLPELVETLIPFLDGSSTLALVKAFPLALKVIQRKTVWVKHVKRLCPFFIYEVVSEEEFEKTLVEEKGSVMNLVGILKMMDNPNPRLLDLLHAIMDGPPPIDRDDVPEEVREEPVNDIPGPEFIRLSCPCDQTFHDISLYGWVFLELAEKEMGSALQKVKWVVADLLVESELLDLDSRLFRQFEKEKDLDHPEVEVNVDVAQIECTSRDSAEAISNLMAFSERVDVQDCLYVSEDIGEEGWWWLRDAVSSKNVAWFASRLEDMASARRDDLMGIFYYTTHGFEVYLDSWDESEEFQDWNQLENILDGAELAALTVDIFADEGELTENGNELEALDGNDDT